MRATAIRHTGRGICLSLLLLLAGHRLGGQAAPRNEYAERVATRKAEMMRRAIGERGFGVPTIRIIGGVEAGPTDNPFQVALLKRSEMNNRIAAFCGGTLIRADIVLTAAHCSDFITAANVQVLTGTRKLDGTGVRRDVAAIRLHPNWQSSNFDYDVALWKLSAPVVGATFPTLATSDGAENSLSLATGWGAVRDGATDMQSILRRVELPLVSFANCNDANSYQGALTGRMLCAGRNEGGVDTCQGDSGGPLTHGAGYRVLIGVTSWGAGCGRPNLFGIYTRVSDPSISAFIRQSF